MAETVFVRTKKDKDYSTIDNTFLRDDTLSMQAKGIFAYILFLPEDWIIYQSELVKHFSNGRDAVAKAISELEEHGYIEKETIKNDKGRFAGCKFIVHEKPLRKTSNGKPVTETPISEIPTVPNTNNNQILNKTNISDTFPEPEEEQPKAKKSSFKKSDYSECVSIITKCQNTLKMKGIQIDETQYPIPILNKWLKQCFTLYGIEDTKKGLINSVTNNWLVSNAHYSISALFSDKVFPKLISGSSLTNKTRYNFFDDDKVRDYSQDEGKW